MNKLKEVIKEYGRWSELSTYVERIEPTGRNRFRSYGANIFIYDILLQRFCSYGANNFIKQSRRVGTFEEKECQQTQSRKNKTYIELRNALLNRIINQSRKNKTYIKLRNTLLNRIINQSRRDETFVEQNDNTNPSSIGAKQKR